MRKLLPALGFAMWLAVLCGGALAQDRQDSNTKQPPMTLWQAIDDVAARFPLSQAKIAAALGTPLREVRRNPYTIFLRNERPIPLSEGGQIAEVDLRLGLAPGDPGFIVLGLQDGCMTLRTVQTHYNDLKISDTPRGRSLDEVTAYSVSLPWGGLSFGFKARNSKCLASVALDPRQPPATLWQAINALSHQLPFSKVNVERLLSTRLSETDEGGNDVFQFFKSDPVSLVDGVVIENVDLRIKRVGPNAGFLVLDTGGRCIGIDDVRTRYKGLRVTDRPRGRSLDEVTSYTATLPWGRLSFSFKERNRQCLASVAFDPKEAETQPAVSNVPTEGEIIRWASAKASGLLARTSTSTIRSKT